MTFANDEAIPVDEIVEGEVEVTFAEEIDRSELDSIPLVPEYDVRPWLTVLPIVCALVIAWNVRWRGGPRRHERRKKKARAP